MFFTLSKSLYLLEPLCGIKHGMIHADTTPDLTLQAFLMKVRQSSELQSKVEQLQRLQPADLPERLAALSADAGTPVMAQAWQSLLAANPDNNGLGDDALENIAGGTSPGHYLMDFLGRLVSRPQGELKL